MGKKEQSFASLADAASALKKLKDHIAESKGGDAKAIPEKRAPPRTGFDDIEAALLRKAEASGVATPSRLKRQEFAVEQAKRGQSTLVPNVDETPDLSKLKAGLLPKRPIENRRSVTPPAAPIIPPTPPACKPESARPPSPSLGLRQPLAPLLRRPIQPEGGIRITPTVTPAPPTAKALRSRIRAVFGDMPPAIEPRPQKTLPWVRSAIEGCIKRGAEIFAARPDPDLSGYIIGCDFGTSSIKLVVRQPYRAGNPIAARPAPNLLQSVRHPYLWQSVLWFDPQSGIFSLLPGKGIALEGFKAGILAGEGGKNILPGILVTRNEAAAAFLALQLAHSFGWYAASRPLGADAAEHFLSVNIGIPVAAGDDSRTFRDFRHIVSAAHCLIPQAANLTHKIVRRCYQASSHEIPNGFDLVPELTAAISGYVNEPVARNGAHILIDVGASTLDTVAFNLVNRERVSAFAAEVGLLGAAALEVSRAEGFEEGLFRQACFDQYDQVFHHARHANVAPREFDPTLRINHIQLIAIGGGCKTSAHTRVIDGIDRALGDLKLMRPTPPAHMTSKKCDTSRLLLAYGLTSDIPEQLELRRPSEIPPISAQTSSSIAFVTKDDV
jgi:hypothetical protein